MRGFATGSLTARDRDGEPLLDRDGFRVGGDRFLETGLELRFPLAGAFSAALFADAGDVWADGQPLDLGRPRLSAGPELWLQPTWLPLPLRLTWAHNLNPEPSDEFDRLLIGFGANF